MIAELMPRGVLARGQVKDSALRQTLEDYGGQVVELGALAGVAVCFGYKGVDQLLG